MDAPYREPQPVDPLGALERSFAPAGIRRFVRNEAREMGAVLAVVAGLLAVAAWNWPTPHVVLGGVLVAIVLANSAWRAVAWLRRPRARVDLHARGVRVHEAGGVLDARWEDVSTLRLVHGERETLCQMIAGASAIALAGADPALMETVAERTEELVAQRMLDELAAGKTVRAGIVTIEPGGLALYGQVLPWSKIKSVRRAGGVLTIETPGLFSAQMPALLASVPNGHALPRVAAAMIERVARR